MRYNIKSLTGITSKEASIEHNKEKMHYFFYIDYSVYTNHDLSKQKYLEIMIILFYTDK